MRVAAIVVHYGDPAMTDRAVRSIDAGSIRPEIITVVDNGPDTLDQARFSAVSTPVEILRPHANIGFGAAINLAIAQQPGFDAYWLLNNDAKARTTALERLIESAEAFECRALTASLVWDEIRDEPWFAGAEFLPWRLESRHRLAAVPDGPDVMWSAPASWRRVPYLAGCSLLVPTPLVSKHGLFDPSYFLYGEDIELAIQALRSGTPLVLAAGSVVDHDLSSATGEAFRQRRYAEASLRLQMRHFPLLTPIALVLGLAAGLARAVRDREASWITERVLGYVARLRAGDDRSPWAPSTEPPPP